MRRSVTVIATFLILLLAFEAAAQEYRGIITGMVTDPSQSVIPDVAVRLTNKATNVVYEARTTSAGIFTFRLLEPGVYQLRAEATGFKSASVDDLVVSTGATVTVNLRMELGDVTQAIEVSAETPLLNTANADAGQVIDEKRIQDLPMNGRSPYALARLSPGVITVASGTTVRPYEVGNQSFLSVGGSRRYTTEFAINGVPNILPFGYFSGRVAYTPPADATQEFRVVTNGFDAQYGHSGAGVVSVTTKSGGNAFHGSLYEFLQNDKLNATAFFVNRAGGRKPPQRINQYGGTVGGPVLLPKLVNGKDKLFFFFAYEGLKRASPGARFATVPTEEMRNGDFSALLARSSPVTIYDPNSVSANASGALVRSPLSGNRIPAQRLNPVFRNILSYVPVPNQPGRLENNLFSTSGTTDDYYNFLGRLDWNISSRQRTFFSIGHYSRVQNSEDIFKTAATGGQFQNPMWFAAFDHTYTFSPTVLFNWRLGYTRWTDDFVAKGVGFDPVKLGFNPTLARQFVEAAFPRIETTYFEPFGVGNRFTHRSIHAHTYFAGAAATHIHGAHNTRYGFELREKRNNEWDRGSTSGMYVSTGQYVAGPSLTAGTAFGQDMAALMLGLPSSGQVENRAAASMLGRYYGFYFQDDWKVTAHLTLNLGLRYDNESPGRERHNRIITDWSDAASPIAAAAIANYAKAPDPNLPAANFKVNGGMRFAGAGGPVSTWERDHRRFQPRLGLVWNPGFLQRRLSFRAGAGVSYFGMAPPSSSTGVYQYGFSAATPFTASVDNGATYIASLSDPFPSGLQKPAGNTLGMATNLGFDGIIIQRNMKPTRSNRYQASIQAQLTRSDVIEINYTGANNNHVIAPNQINAIPDRFMGKSYTRDDAAIAFLSAPVANPFLNVLPANSTLGRASIARSQLLMPYPHFSTLFLAWDNSGSITFQSVYLAWERRFAKGLTVLSNYMISKQMWARDRLNPQDTKLSRRVGGEDRPQQLTVSASYELPFGRSQKFLSSTPAILDRVVSGWQLGGIYFAQSGPVINWGAMVFTGNSWADIARVPGGRSINQWFNTAVFDRTAARQPNTSYQYRYFPLSIAAARSPGANAFDFSITKKTAITEQVNLQFRGEFYNFTNTPNFGAPNTTATSSAFGTITSQANLPRAIQLGLRLSF